VTRCRIPPRPPNSPPPTKPQPQHEHEDWVPPVLRQTENVIDSSNKTEKAENEEQKALKLAAMEEELEEIQREEIEIAHSVAQNETTDDAYNDTIEQQQQHQELPPVNAATTPESDRSVTQSETTDDVDDGAIVRPQRHHRQPRPTELPRTVVIKISKVAMEVYWTRTNNVATNRVNIQEIVDKYPLVFSPILERNPHFVEDNASAHVCAPLRD